MAPPDGLFDKKTFLYHSTFTIGVLGILIPIILFFIPIHLNNDNQGISENQLNDINGKLTHIDIEISSINVRLQTIDDRLTLVQSQLSELQQKKTGGRPIAVFNNGSNYSISITNPLNNSTVTKRFLVNGLLNFQNMTQYKIYIISKLGSKYWIQTEGNKDDSGTWCGYRPCVIPNNYNKSIIYALISNEDYLIGQDFENIPDHIVISKPVYVSCDNMTHS